MRSVGLKIPTLCNDARLKPIGEFIREFSPESVEYICGVKAGLIYEAARLYATAKPSMCFHGLGVTNASATEAALKSLDFLVVQDMFLNERDGTFRA